MTLMADICEQPAAVDAINDARPNLPSDQLFVERDGTLICCSDDDEDDDVGILPVPVPTSRKNSEQMSLSMAALSAGDSRFLHLSTGEE